MAAPSAPVKTDRGWRLFARTVIARAYPRLVGQQRDLAWLFYDTFLPFLGTVGYVYVYRAIQAPEEYIGYVVMGGAMTAFWMNVIWSMAQQFYWEKEGGNLALYIMAPNSLMAILLGMAIGPALQVYVSANGAQVLWQAAGATALFIAAFGAWGYATRRDLAPYVRFFFWALIGLIVFGIVMIFVQIPAGYLIWSILGLAIFAFWTAFDFQRLRKSTTGNVAVPIALGIFLDIFNVFLFFLQIFGGGGR